MRKNKMAKFMILLMVGAFCFSGNVWAKSAREIDASVDTALERFEREVFGAKDLLAKSKGVLILPRVLKIGFVLGGEYGTGALRVRGKTVDYYNIIAGSLGVSLGAQVKSIYLFFMEESALKDFRASEGWQAGADGSVVLLDMGADGSIDTTKTDEPIIAYVLNQKGLMYNLSIEGAKFNKITPD